MYLFYVYEMSVSLAVCLSIPQHRTTNLRHHRAKQRHKDFGTVVHSSCQHSCTNFCTKKARRKHDICTTLARIDTNWHRAKQRHEVWHDFGMSCKVRAYILCTTLARSCILRAKILCTNFCTIMHSSCQQFLHELLHELLHGESTKKAQRKHEESTKKAQHLHEESTTLHKLRISSCQSKSTKNMHEVCTKFARLLHVVQSSC